MPKVVFLWKNPSISDAWNSCKNFSVEYRYCYWKDSRDGYFKNSMISVKIVLQQECDNVSSEFTDINTGEIVKPNPVSSISSRAVNSSCIQLFWDTTDSEPQNPKEHRIIVSSEGQNYFTFKFSTTRTTERFPHEKTFCSLHPYTEYTFSVRIKPTGYYSGFFSDPRRTVSRTYPDRPSASPEVTEGGFNWNYRDCEGSSQERRVCVFWKSIKKEHKNGPMVGVQGWFKTTVGQFVSGVWAENSTYGCKTVLCNTSYHFTVQARNINGTSGNDSTIEIPRYCSEIERPEFIVESANTSDVYISWSYLGNIIAKGFTVAWCRNQNGDCESGHEINWKRFPGNRKDAILQIKTSAQDFLYGVSVLTELGSSGTEWQDCVYSKYKNPKREPQNVIVSVGSEDNTLVVTWDKLTCTSDEPYIAMYNVRYSKPNDRKKTSINVTAVGEARVVLKSLEKDQPYGVTVRGITKDGRIGPESLSQRGIPINKNLIAIEIAGISMAVLVCVTFAAVGFFCVLRKCKKTAQDAIREAGTITLPDAPDPKCYTSLERNSSDDSGYDMTPPLEKITMLNAVKLNNKLYERPDEYSCATVGNDESPQVLHALEPEIKWPVSDRLDMAVPQKGSASVLSQSTKGLKLMQVIPKPLAFIGTSESVLSSNESDAGTDFLKKKCIDDVKCKRTSADVTDSSQNAPHATTEHLNKNCGETRTILDDYTITQGEQQGKSLNDTEMCNDYFICGENAVLLEKTEDNCKQFKKTDLLVSLCSCNENVDDNTLLSECPTVSTNNTEESQHTLQGYVPVTKESSLVSQNPPSSANIMRVQSETNIVPDIPIFSKNSQVPQSSSEDISLPSDLVIKCTNNCARHSNAIQDVVACTIAADFDNVSSCTSHSNTITISVPSYDTQSCIYHDVPKPIVGEENHSISRCTLIPCANGKNIDSGYSLSSEDNAAGEQDENGSLSDIENAEDRKTIQHQETSSFLESVDFKKCPEEETETGCISRAKDGYIPYYVLKDENGQVYLPGNHKM